MKYAQALLVMLFLGARAVVAADAPVIEVWKSRTCGCCVGWVRHVEAAGFTVKVNDLDDVAPVKQRLKVPPELSSCHTAVVDGYVVEGHVPADSIVRLLKLKPAVTGIYVPGMPIGSPGMEGPNAETYDVVAIGKDGEQTVFATHGPK